MAKRTAKVKPKPPAETAAWFVIAPEGNPLVWTGTKVEEWSIRAYVDFVKKTRRIADWDSLTKDGYRCVECTVSPIKSNS